MTKFPIPEPIQTFSVFIGFLFLVHCDTVSRKQVLKLLQGDDDVLKWARSQVSGSECSDDLDEVTNPTPDIQSYINLALQDIDEDSHSVSSTEPSVDFITGNTSLEDYLQGRWSRSSSFD